LSRLGVLCVSYLGDSHTAVWEISVEKIYLISVFLEVEVVYILINSFTQTEMISCVQISLYISMIISLGCILKN
jgi:hypothetical protein